MTSLQNYSGRGLSFAYPSTWKLTDVGTIAGVGGLLYPVVCVSTEPLAACGQGAAPLRADGVNVTWRYGNFTFDSTAPRPTGVTRAYCTEPGAQGGTQVEYHARLDNPKWYLAYVVQACWRGPDVKTIRGQVQAMLASVKVTGLQVSTTTRYPPCHVQTQTQPPGAPPRIDQSTPCIPP